MGKPVLGASLADLENLFSGNAQSQDPFFPELNHGPQLFRGKEILYYKLVN